MFEVNIKIISELKSFLHICSTDPSVLGRLRRSDTDFTRNRKLGFSRLVLFICKLCKHTLSVELDLFFESDLGLSHSCSVAAFSLQRKKLSHCFFQFWNELLCQCFYYYGHTHKQVRTWRGMRLIAADGSGVSLISNPALRAHFGGQTNQQGHFTGARAFFHYDVLNKLFTYSRLAPYRTPELDMAWEAIDHLPADSICIYDRNFSTYKTIALHQWSEVGHRFVIRAKEGLRVVRSFLATGLPSQVIMMYPCGPQAIEGMRKAGYVISPATGLKVRLVRVALPEGGTEVLFTNLWEEEGYDTGVFRELYFRRWGIETAISTAKNLLQLESFSAQSVESVYQDFYATVFMANLTGLLVRGTRQPHTRQREGSGGIKVLRKWPVQVNMNKASGRLRSSVVMLFSGADPADIVLSLTDYFARHWMPVRKGRSFTRKRRNRQSNSKHKTFTNYKPAY